MELTWKRYVITLRAPVWVRKTQAQSAKDPANRETFGSVSLEQPRQASDKEYILASGSRYVGPIR